MFPYPVTDTIGLTKYDVKRGLVPALAYFPAYGTLLRSQCTSQRNRPLSYR